jgi:outer membrane protein assembly factor BamA
MPLNTLLTTASLLLTPPDSLPPKPLSLLPLPLIYYTPETRLAYGAALTATFRFRRDSATAQTPQGRPSQVTLGVAHTQNQQLLFYVPFQVFYDHDRYYLTGEAGYYRYNYFFFGVGQTDVPAELYGVNFPRIRVNAFRQVLPTIRRGKLYAGLRYQYEDYAVTTVEPGGLLATNTAPGGLGSRLSGGGLGLFYDSRDYVFFPTKGIVADLTYLIRNRATRTGPQGETTYFDRYALEVSSYHRLHRRAVLALNYVGSFTVGPAPFNAMSLLGGTKRLRGYYEGRFRDQHAALFQSEVRMDVYGRLGAVVFGGVGVLGNEQQLLRLADPKLAYGAGLRFTANRRDHVNIRVDYAVGSQASTGLYITLGEAF